MPSHRQAFEALLHKAEIALDNTVCDQLIELVGLIDKWNRVYNLTAIRNPHEMLSRHLLDSLTLLPYLDDAPQTTSLQVFDLMDMGSGAGLPILPLAIARPRLRMLSVESNGKKARFQVQAALELELSNVTVAQKRIEDVEAYAVTVVSRAFRAPATFLQHASPRCAEGGQALIMLGKAEKLPETLPDGFSLVGVHAVELPGSDAMRHIAQCRRQ